MCNLGYFKLDNNIVQIKDCRNLNLHVNEYFCLNKELKYTSEVDFLKVFFFCYARGIHVGNTDAKSE